MHEAVGEDLVRDDADSGDTAHERHELSLNVRWNSRIWQSATVNRIQVLWCRNTYGRVAHGISCGKFFDNDTDSTQCFDDRGQVAEADPFHHDVSASDRSGHHQCGCFNPIRDHCVFGSVQTLDALDVDERRAQTGDLCSHGIQEMAQVDDFRFAGGRFNGGLAFGQRSGRHDVARTGCRTAERSAQVHATAAQTLGLGDHVPAFDADIGPQSPEPFQVQVDGAVADVAASRQRDASVSSTCQQRAQNAETRPHATYQFVVGNTRPLVDDFQQQRSVLATFGLHAKRTQQIHERPYVHKIRDCAKNAWPFRSENGCHDGQCRILGSTNADPPA